MQKGFGLRAAAWACMHVCSPPQLGSPSCCWGPLLTPKSRKTGVLIVRGLLGNLVNKGSKWNSCLMGFTSGNDVAFTISTTRSNEILPISTSALPAVYSDPAALGLSVLWSFEFRVHGFGRLDA